MLKLSQVIIANNKGSGVDTNGHCTVIFTEGQSIIASNRSPNDGGGIYLDYTSHLTTSDGGHVSFINNTAKRYGGAIYSLNNDNRAFMQWIYYPTDDQCSVNYNFSATFTNNSAAIAGNVLYGGTFIGCRYFSAAEPDLFYILKCPTVPVTISTCNCTSIVNPLSQVSSDPIVVCPCFNNIVNCSIRSFDHINKDVYPGQMFDISLVSVGLCGGVTPGTIAVTHVEESLHIISSEATDHTFNSCTTLQYTVKLTSAQVYSARTKLVFDVADGDLYHKRGHVDVYLTILPCPLGLVLNSVTGDCVCDNDIQMSGVKCNTSWMPYPIRRSGNNWISQHMHERYNCAIVHIGCPFDYCNASDVRLSLNESDLLCNYNRSGILCGQCKQGLSLMIGSNRCSNCTDTKLTSISIFIIAVVAGILLVFTIMALNLTVSVGSINGILFYANIVKLNESVFFSQGNIPVISQFISWCNLDLGIEYCFIDGLDGYIKTWLQFAFPLYVWVLVIVIIVTCRYSGRLSRLTGRNAVPVLATLILMSYTKLSRTVTNALMMNTIRCGEYRWKVWNVDANIHYLSAKHAILFTVSLLFLIIGLVYTGLVFCSQWLQRYSGKCCKSTRDPVVYFKPLIDAYTGPFKDRYRFWTGLCLMIRFILTVVFSFTTALQSRLNNYIILITVSPIIVFGRVYRDRRLTVLELLSYTNLSCLCLMTILFTDDSYLGIMPTNTLVSISVSIEILLCFIICILHGCSAIRKVFSNFKLCQERLIPLKNELPLINGDTDEGTLLAHREELIFD